MAKILYHPQFKYQLTPKTIRIYRELQHYPLEDKIYTLRIIHTEEYSISKLEYENLINLWLKEMENHNAI
jgi:hypothetical protein